MPKSDTEFVSRSATSVEVASRLVVGISNRPQPEKGAINGMRSTPPGSTVTGISMPLGPKTENGSKNGLPEFVKTVKVPWAFASDVLR